MSAIDTNSALDGAPHAGSIGRITTTGVVTQLRDPGIHGAEKLAVGADGALWFTTIDAIGRVTTSGVITLFPASPAHGITAGPDGAIWFTTYSGAVGRVAMNGAMTSFSLGGQSAFGGITTGPDGALWFPMGESIARMTTAGAMTSFPVSRSQVDRIAVGPDGALWFTGFRSIGRITTDGAVSTATLVRRQVSSLVVGPDGHLWGTGADQLLQLDTSGITKALVPAIANPADLAAGPNGELVVMNYGGSFGSFLGSGAPFSSRPEGIDSPSAGVTGPDRAFWVVNGPNEIARWHGSVLSRFSSSKVYEPQAIAVGPDRRIWYANNDKSLGRRNPDGTFNLFKITARARSMVAGADGALWFTTGGSLGRITPAGVVTERIVHRGAGKVIRDAKGAVWFASDGALIRIEGDGSLSTFPVSGMSGTYDIAAGTDGAIWFLDGTGSRVGRRNQAGGISYYELGMRFAQKLAPGADGAMWFAGGAGVARMTPPGPVVFRHASVGAATVVEGDDWSRRMPVNVTLDAPAVVPIVVGVGLGNAGNTNPADLQAGTGTALFLPGDTSATTSFIVNGDRGIEPDEHFVIHGRVASGTAHMGQKDSQGTILNDDPPAPSPMLSIGDASVVEGRSGTRRLRVAVTLSNIAQQPVRVHWTTVPLDSGSASEYLGASGVLELPAGATERDLTVLIKGDTKVEPDQRFMIWLSYSENAPIRRTAGTMTIIDDD
ncbi:MAG: Calx-beta domain-containing protein [Acidimicrobiia bacterium]